MKVKSLSRVRLLATPWTTAYQTPPSMGFSRQEYWSGVPLPSPAIVHRVTKNSDMNKPVSNNNKFPNILSFVHQHLIIVVEVLKDFEKIII